MRIVVHDYAGHPFQFDLSRNLARRGHTVHHLYFAGDPGPKGRAESDGRDPEGLTVLPVGIDRPYAKADFIGRWRNDKLYGAATAEHIRQIAPDIVVSGNAPLDSQNLIIAASQDCGAAFVNWIQDFYGVAIERLLSRRWLGAGRLIARHYREMERRQLMDSDAVILISENFRRYLPEPLRRTAAVAVIPNWGALADIPLRPKHNRFAGLHHLEDKFVFLYSGTLGLKHNPDFLIALADAFADQHEVKVVIAATGMGRERLQADLTAKPRSNLVLLPLQAFEDLPDMLGAADVLVAVLEREAGEFSVPSKVLSYMCAGRPILLSAPPTNFASKIILEHGVGDVVEPDDLWAFIKAAKDLHQNPQRRARLGAAGRAYAESHFELDGIVDQFEAVFASAISSSQRRRDRRAKAA